MSAASACSELRRPLLAHPPLAGEASEMRCSPWFPQGGALIIFSGCAGGFNLDNYRVKRPRLYSAVRRPISPLTPRGGGSRLVTQPPLCWQTFILLADGVQARPGQIRPDRKCQIRSNQIRLDPNRLGLIKRDQTPD